MNRRDFLQTNATALGIGAILPFSVDTLIDLKRKFRIGFQSWVVREPLNEDFAGTLGKLKKQGFDTVEMYSASGPKPYF